MTTTAPAAIIRDIEVPFDLERSTDNDGRTFEGYAAVFNRPANISDVRGQYTETVAPGAFKNSINRRMPQFMFNHGLSAPIGEIPIGKVVALREDPRGLYVKARLVDNPTVNIIRDAIRDEAITGMSFHATIIRDQWSRDRKHCTLKELALKELGPVTKPAYQGTSAAVRSMLEDVAHTYGDIVRIEMLRADDDELTTWDETPADKIRDAVMEAWGLGDVDTSVDLIDVFDDHALFVIAGVKKDEYHGLWQVTFTKNADGTVAVSAPSRPPLASYATTTNPAGPDEGMNPAGSTTSTVFASEASTSDDAAINRTSSDAAARKEDIIKKIMLRQRGINV